MRARVLVSAPQAAIRADLALTLMPLGYEVEAVSSEKAVRQLTSKQRFVAAIVTAGSAAVDDIEFIHRVRNSADKLVLLAEDAGATERLARSFPEALLCSSERLEHDRLRDFLSNPAPDMSDPAVSGTSEFLHFAGRTLDLAGRVFLDATGREVALTRAEFGLLVAFARNPGQALSRSHLRKAMDGGTLDAYGRSIDMLVTRLRRKIEPEPARPQFIITLPGLGYKFVAHVQTTANGALPPAPDRSGDAAVAAHVERRQVTVLSCQILGFAELAATLDPEDLQPATSPAYAACAAIIGRFAGTTLRTMGDDVVACFGYPNAQENNAENAVRAALELLRVLRTIEAAPIGSFRTRIGIATGLMVVGEFPDRGAHRGPTAIGSALNLAPHLQKAAPAEGIFIEATTRRLIGSFFECREVEPVELEERLDPVPAWQVIGERAGTPRFDGLRRDGMIGLVGREVELERLQHYWSKAVRGAGQVVLLTGEPGIGKSRLIVEAQNRLRCEPCATLRYYGAPHQADASMSVLIDELQRSAGLANGDTAAQKVAKLQHEFSALGPAAAEAAALSCVLLGLPHDAPPDIGQLSPKSRKERTFAALLARIEAAAAPQPVFAVVEDAHWLDPTSLEFVALLVEKCHTLPLLLVIVARPEFVPPWPEHSHVTTLALSRLSQADSVDLIERLAGERRIAKAVQNAIVARADGVPLFVEELTRSILENAAAADSGAPAPLTTAIAPIPTTLQGLLLTRFDRVGRGKEVAQIGAVIGREFSYELLHIVAGLDEAALRDALSQLVASGLVFRRGSPPGETFVFKHALVRDAAYGMLPRDSRRKRHAAVARAYEENSADTAQAQPELLAHHWREGGDPIKAAGYLLTAAGRALHRSATVEALSHLAQARELISNEPLNNQRLQLELTLELTSARALLATRGYTAIETRQAYLRARERCEALGDDSSLPLIMHNCLLLLGFADKAEAMAKAAARLDPSNLYSQALAQTRLLRMRFFERNASATAEIGAAVIRLCQDHNYPHLGSMAMVYSGWAMAQCGDPAGGTALCERGLVQLQDVSAACWLPPHLAMLAECHHRAGNHNSAVETVTRALASVESTGERLWESEIYRFKGALMLDGGDAAAAANCFMTALDKARAQQAKLFELRAAVSLARLWLSERKPGQARAELAPVYGWFTEGFRTLHLREAKMLLDRLS